MIKFIKNNKIRVDKKTFRVYKYKKGYKSTKIELKELKTNI